MRTWIIMGCFSICYAINPDQIVPVPYAIILIAITMAGMAMDLIEFIWKKGY